MLELSRTIRACLAHDGSLHTEAARDNTFAAWPPMQGLGRYYELVITCRGEVEAVTGYFMNIKQIDEAGRHAALPLLSAAVRQPPPVAMGRLMRDMIHEVDRALHGAVASMALCLTPTCRLTIEKDTMHQVLLTQSYEFSAAHRLHAPRLSDDENRRIFGRCNNPAGHGHNYRLEVTVACPPDDDGHILEVQAMDAIVRSAVIDKLDHKHLDRDVPQFAHLNSTVENIARVIYEMLRDPVQGLGAGLLEVRVWETGKTVCTYRGDGAALR